MNPKWHTTDPLARLNTLIKIRSIALTGAILLIAFGLFLLLASLQPSEVVALGIPVHTYLLTASLFLLALAGGVVYVAIVTAREIAQGRDFLASRNNAPSRQ